MKVPQVTIYAKQAGVEITPYIKRSDGRPDKGRVALRFFSQPLTVHTIVHTINP